MQVTNVEITTNSEHEGGKLLGFATVTFDNCFVVLDIKIIRGTNGIFVAMPSRKITETCQACYTKNHLQARFCNGCGIRLQPKGGAGEDRIKLHCDVAHPINVPCRTAIEQAVISAYEARRLPGRERVA